MKNINASLQNCSIPLLIDILKIRRKLTNLPEHIDIIKKKQKNPEYIKIQSTVKHI